MIRVKQILSSAISGLALTLGLLWLLGGMSAAAAELEQGPMKRLHATTSELHVCPVGCTYTTVQAAVDNATAGDVIKVATGTYTDVSSREGVTQTVYISETVTVRGGYTVTNWTAPDPEANPTTLDAQGQGRVLYITGNISPTIQGLRITDGRADGKSGGGVYIADASATLSETWVFGNAASTGGGLYVHGGSAMVNETEMFDNAAGANGGAVFLADGAVTLDSTQVLSNGAGANGGALYIAQGSATLGSTAVMSNTAANSGGGVFVSVTGAELTVSGGTISANTASNPAQGGGGVYVFQGSAALSGTQLISNTADGYGGGTFVYAGIATLTDTDIISNTGGTGGGVCVYGSSATLNARGGTIHANGASSGSGVYARGGSVTLESTEVISNLRATYGGGIYVHGANVTLSATTVISNAASQWGGGVYLYEGSPRLNMRGGAIRANTADCGGGLYARGGSAALTDTQLVSNTASNGGAMYLYVGSATLSETQVVSNVAGNDGGGLYLNQASATLTMSGGSIGANGANGDGGGAYVRLGSATLTGTQVVGNDAQGEGGGVYAKEDASLDLTNALLASNTATHGAGGISLDHASASVVNCTIADNTALAGVHGVWASPDGGQTVAFTNTILWHKDDDLHCPSGCTVAYSDLAEGVWPGPGNISQDPRFADRGAGDYHVPVGSPCADVGTAADAPGDDFEGDARPWGFGVDIGADEFAGHVVAPGCYDFLDPVGVGVEDVQFIAAHWRWSAATPYDVDDDGIITVVDIMRAAADWGETCP